MILNVNDITVSSPQCKDSIVIPMNAYLLFTRHFFVNICQPMFQLNLVRNSVRRGPIRGAGIPRQNWTSGRHIPERNVG